MACENIKNAFYALSNQVSDRLYNKVAPVDPWTAMTPRGEFPKGQGLVISNMLLERTVTDDESGDEWTDATLSGSGDVATTNNNCLPTPEVLTFGQTLRTFQIARRNIQTENFCINDLNTDFQISRVLNNVMDILAFVTEWVWSNRIQNKYLDLCEHKVTERISGFDIDATSFSGATPPNSRLLQGTLEQIYIKLIQEGAYMGAMGEGPIGYGVNDQPIFTLFTDANTSRDLIRQDPELRMDFRYADPDKLINPLGTPYSYNGFKHVWLKYPPRWEVSGGNYVRVYPFLPVSAATKGFKRQVNSAYINASYQTSFIFIPTVQTVLFENPDRAPGGGVKFNYASHMGEFQFLVIPDKTCNPRGELGFFDALYASAHEPGQTYLGWAIMHMNCPPLRVPHSSCYS